MTMRSPPADSSSEARELLLRLGQPVGGEQHPPEDVAAAQLAGRGAEPLGGGEQLPRLVVEVADVGARLQQRLHGEQQIGAGQQRLGVVGAGRLGDRREQRLRLDRQPGHGLVGGGERVTAAR